MFGVWQWCMLFLMVGVHAAVAVRANFERIEQLDDREFVNLDVRVRKYNRTSMVLNGTLYVNRVIDSTIEFTTKAFLSRLGNQQFVHSPIHLPTANVCEFLDYVHDEYESVISDVVNLPHKSECPITERAMHVKDKLFPVEVLPKQLPVGLWKMEFTGKLNEEEVIKLMASIRLSDDYTAF